MNDLEKACELAIKDRIKFYGENAPETKIKKIRETSLYYVIDFYTKNNAVICGGGGILVSKKDFSLIDYCIPSYPMDIMSFIFTATPLEIPAMYR